MRERADTSAKSVVAKSVMFASLMIVMLIAAIFSGVSVGTMIWILPFPPVIVGAGPHRYPLQIVMFAVATVILGVILFFGLRRRTWLKNA